MREFGGDLNIRTTKNIIHRNLYEGKRSGMFLSTRVRSQMCSRTKSYRSEMDITDMSERNKTKLLDIFLPDIRRLHTRIGYTQRFNSFNLNQENLKTVQLRGKTAWCKERQLKEHRDVTLGSGRKAANSVSPRPCWGYKSLPIYYMNDRLFSNNGQSYSAYVKRQLWASDMRGSERPLPISQFGKITKM